MSKKDIFEYESYMCDVQSLILAQVLDIVAGYNEQSYNAESVRRALAKESLNIEDLQALLSPVAEGFLEEIALKARHRTKQHFGDNVALFTPLYLSNHCESKCV